MSSQQGLITFTLNKNGLKNGKQIIFILTFSLGLLSCNNQSKKVDLTTVADTQPKQVDKSKYYTQVDTVLIATEIGDTLKYAKANFNSIVEKHSEFFEEFPDNPDLAYFNGNNKEEFASEAGQDIYYILYAYFLKQRNGIKEFAEQRQKLIKIYSNINSLFGHLKYGGTYFGHQSKRIVGYAEYSVFILPKDKKGYTKTYEIIPQKKLYIKSLRQLIDDESTIDNNTIGQDKILRIKKLNKIIDELDNLITDNFYLRRAQEFHYEHYEYY